MIVRVSRRDTFTVIANDTIRDPNLSFRATGVLAFLLSMPDGWEVKGRVLADAKKEGRDAVFTALGELEEHGYLVRTKERREDGTWTNVSIVYERPVLENRQPSPDNQDPDNQDPDSQDSYEVPDKKEPQETPTSSDPLTEMARRVVKRWWEEQTPRPAQNFVAVVKIVRKMLAAGWEPKDVYWALGEAPTPSVGTLEFALNRHRRRKGSPEAVRSAAEEYLRRHREGVA